MSNENAKRYRVIRTCVETYCCDVEADNPNAAVALAKADDEQFDHVESSAWEYHVIPADQLV